MNFDNYLANLKALNQRNAWLSVAVAALSISTLILVVSIIGKHDRIVVVPPGLSGETSVNWNSADVQYITAMATTYATAVGSINPKNINTVVDKLSALSEPAFYSILKKKLLARTLNPAFTGSGVSTSFTPTASTVYDPEINTVYVYGEESVNTAYGPSKISPFIYEVILKIVEGRPVIYGITSYPGLEAHTPKWKTDHPDKVKEKD